MKTILIGIAVLLLALNLSGCRSENNVAKPESPMETTVINQQVQGDETMYGYDFSAFPNVKISGIDLKKLSEEELSVLYTQARYCQAMTDADIDTMREIVSEDMVFTHMSGRRQTRDEYFADIADGHLDYYTIGIEKPVIEIDGDQASITFTSVLNANAYGAVGTCRMKGTHHSVRADGNWIAVNG